MSSVFSKIIEGEIPAYKVAENEDFLAFLDVNPLCKGHTLVIPKKEVDYIFDMSDESLAAFHLFAKRIAIAIKKEIPCIKVGLAVVGLEVPHAHIHLVPMNSIGDLNFKAERVSLNKEEFENIASKIAGHL